MAPYIDRYDTDSTGALDQIYPQSPQVKIKKLQKFARMLVAYYIPSIDICLLQFMGVLALGLLADLL
jgi:hypothetical protein